MRVTTVAVTFNSDTQMAGVQIEPSPRARIESTELLPCVGTLPMLDVDEPSPPLSANRCDGAVVEVDAPQSLAPGEPDVDPFQNSHDLLFLQRVLAGLRRL